MKRLFWYLRQILPLSYHSVYFLEDGKKQICLWNMQFGRSFNIRTFDVA